MVSARKYGRWSVVVGLLAATSCKPDVEGRASLIDGPRVLAIRSVPAEAPPDAVLKLEALYVDEGSQAPDGSKLAWASCTRRKPLSVAGAIDPECLQKSGAGIEAIGRGVEASFTVATDACRLFGPTPPTPENLGDPALRAADPDITGGYYQPVTARFPSSEGDAYAVGVTRLACGIGSATQEQVLTYNQKYKANENPEVSAIELDDSGRKSELLAQSIEAAEAPGASESVKIKRGSTVSLTASWAADCRQCNSDGTCDANENKDSCSEDCPDKAGCGGAETYVTFDTAAREIVTQKEQIRVSWFATDGSFEHDRTAANLATSKSGSTNSWTAPTTAGLVSFWIVLRDDRRGVGWQQFQIEVTE